MDFPLTFIGNMPRLLVSSGWTFHIIEASEIRSGDLIFLKRKAEPKLIAHLALALDVDRVFHCKRNVGMKLESLESLFTDFEQKIIHDQLKYIDPRDKKQRAVHGGCFMKS